MVAGSGFGAWSPASHGDGLSLCYFGSSISALWMLDIRLAGVIRYVSENGDVNSGVVVGYVSTLWVLGLCLDRSASAWILNPCSASAWILNPCSASAWILTPLWVLGLCLDRMEAS